jgi:hypothetical protein
MKIPPLVDIECCRGDGIPAGVHFAMVVSELLCGMIGLILFPFRRWVTVDRMRNEGWALDVAEEIASRQNEGE